MPARKGAILPIEWKLNKDVLIHYVTSEIVEIMDDGSVMTLRTDQAEFFDPPPAEIPNLPVVWV